MPGFQKLFAQKLASPLSTRFELPSFLGTPSYHITQDIFYKLKLTEYATIHNVPTQQRTMVNTIKGRITKRYIKVKSYLLFSNESF